MSGLYPVCVRLADSRYKRSQFLFILVPVRFHTGTDIHTPGAEGRDGMCHIFYIQPASEKIRHGQILQQGPIEHGPSSAGLDRMPGVEQHPVGQTICMGLLHLKDRFRPFHAEGFPDFHATRKRGTQLFHIRLVFSAMQLHRPKAGTHNRGDDTGD